MSYESRGYEKQAIHLQKSSKQLHPRGQHFAHRESSVIPSNDGRQRKLIHQDERQIRGWQTRIKLDSTQKEKSARNSFDDQNLKTDEMNTKFHSYLTGGQHRNLEKQNNVSENTEQKEF